MPLVIGTDIWSLALTFGSFIDIDINNDMYRETGVDNDIAVDADMNGDIVVVIDVGVDMDTNMDIDIHTVWSPF